MAILFNLVSGHAVKTHEDLTPEQKESIIEMIDNKGADYEGNTQMLFILLNQIVVLNEGDYDMALNMFIKKMQQEDNEA